MPYRIKVHRSRKGERRGSAETDYAALLDAAHQCLNAPIVVVGDNLNVHLSVVMRELLTNRDRLHVVQPGPQPTEAVWSHVKRNLATNGVDRLAVLSATGSSASSTGQTY